jgi:hypothetical protein
MNIIDENIVLFICIINFLYTNKILFNKSKRYILFNNHVQKYQYLQTVYIF